MDVFSKEMEQLFQIENAKIFYNKVSNVWYVFLEKRRFSPPTDNIKIILNEYTYTISVQKSFGYSFEIIEKHLKFNGLNKLIVKLSDNQEKEFNLKVTKTPIEKFIVDTSEDLITANIRIKFSSNFEIDRLTYIEVYLNGFNIDFIPISQGIVSNYDYLKRYELKEYINNLNNGSNIFEVVLKSDVYFTEDKYSYTLDLNTDSLKILSIKQDDILYNGINLDGDFTHKTWFISSNINNKVDGSIVEYNINGKFIGHGKYKDGFNLLLENENVLEFIDFNKVIVNGENKITRILKDKESNILDSVDFIENINLEEYIYSSLFRNFEENTHIYKGYAENLNELYRYELYINDNIIDTIYEGNLSNKYLEFKIQNNLISNGICNFEIKVFSNDKYLKSYDQKINIKKSFVSNVYFEKNKHDSRYNLYIEVNENNIDFTSEYFSIILNGNLKNIKNISDKRYGILDIDVEQLDIVKNILEIKYIENNVEIFKDVVVCFIPEAIKNIVFLKHINDRKLYETWYMSFEVDEIILNNFDYIRYFINNREFSLRYHNTNEFYENKNRIEIFDICDSCILEGMNFIKIQVFKNNAKYEKIFQVNCLKNSNIFNKIIKTNFQNNILIFTKIDEDKVNMNNKEIKYYINESLIGVIDFKDNNGFYKIVAPYRIFKKDINIITVKIVGKDYVSYGQEQLILRESNSPFKTVELKNSLDRKAILNIDISKSFNMVNRKIFIKYEYEEKECVIDHGDYKYKVDIFKEHLDSNGSIDLEFIIRCYEFEYSEFINVKLI